MQLHKRINNETVKIMFEKYDKKEVSRVSVQESIGVGKTRFFALLKKYKEEKNEFSVAYTRKAVSKISEETEQFIREELMKEKELIENPDIPRYNYNYAEINRKLAAQNIKVSAMTISQRAKGWNFCIEKRDKKHDRSIKSHAIGELIHIDNSYALFSPASGKHWLLTTFTDDYSRYILDVTISETDSSNYENNVKILDKIFATYGVPKQYNLTSFSSREFIDIEDMLKNNKIDVVEIKDMADNYAMFQFDASYRKLKENLTSECIAKSVTNIQEAQKIINELVKKNNYNSINPVSQEPPYLRFKNGNSVWRKDFIDS